MRIVVKARGIVVAAAVAGILATTVPASTADEPCGTQHIDIRHNFTSGNLNAWELPYAQDWDIQQEGDLHYLHMKNWQPGKSPHHPIQFARLKSVKVGSFTLDVDVRSHGESMAIEFNYEDPVHFYYVHLSNVRGAQDFRHNGIYIVNSEPRRRITGLEAAPALPDHKWHHVRIVRNVSDGSIKIYMDHEDSPRFSVVDHHFTCGQVGLGSFDETGDYAHFHLTSNDAENGNGAAK